jgi:hypothetical protein
VARIVGPPHLSSAKILKSLLCAPKRTWASKPTDVPVNPTSAVMDLRFCGLTVNLAPCVRSSASMAIGVGEGSQILLTIMGIV